MKCEINVTITKPDTPIGMFSAKNFNLFVILPTTKMTMEIGIMFPQKTMVQTNLVIGLVTITTFDMTTILTHVTKLSGQNVGLATIGVVKTARGQLRN